MLRVTVYSCPEFFLCLNMKIRINSKETETGAATLMELAREMGLPEKGVAMAVSNRMVPRVEWSTTSISGGEDIVIIKAVCGG